MDFMGWLKRTLLTFAFVLVSSGAWAQCNGVFLPNYVCGNISESPAPPTGVPSSSFPGGGTVSSGTAGQSAYYASTGSVVVGVTPPGVNVFDFLTTSQITAVLASTCTGGSPTDVTTALQAAITSAGTNSRLDWPPGCYFISATLAVPSGQYWKGAGVNSTRIHRTGNFGDTIKVGTTTPGFHAGPFHIDGFWLTHGTNYNQGDTSLSNLATSGCHIDLVSPQGAIIENVWAWRLPFQFCLLGGSVTTLDNLEAVGYWDPLNTPLQEGIANFYLYSSTVFGNPTTIRMSRIANGGGPSEPRNVSFVASDRTTVVNMVQNIGSEFGLYVAGCEDCTLTSSYLGGASVSNVRFAPAANSANLDIRISHNHFDGATTSQLTVDSGATGAQIRGLTIDNNIFNMEATGINQIQLLNDPFPQINVFECSINNNTFFASIGAPIISSGATLCTITGNTFTSYNQVYNLATSTVVAISLVDPTYTSAGYFTNQSSNITVENNVVGGQGSFTYDGFVLGTGGAAPTNVVIGPNHNSGTTRWYGGMDGGPWTAFTPMVTITGGSGTNSTGSTGAYFFPTDKMLCFRADLTINYSSAPSAIQMALPTAAANNGTQSVSAYNNTQGYALMGRIGVGTGNVLIQKYDGTAAAAATGNEFALGPSCIEIQ